MGEETLFKFEKKMNKIEISEHIDKISEKLKADEPITFESDKSVKLTPSAQPEFEIKVEEESDGDISLEMEIEWNKKDESTDLEIG
ncbi:MAG: amphi-Trp domain-containing protein [Candidatus Nanohaloarchaea archaeon]